MVHLLAEKYGWMIEYIMNLSMKQIRSLVDGERIILEIRDRNKDGKGSVKNNNVTPSNKKDGTSVYEMLSIPGVKLSEKAKSVMNKIQQKKIDNLKEKK